MEEKILEAKAEANTVLDFVTADEGVPGSNPVVTTNGIKSLGRVIARPSSFTRTFSLPLPYLFLGHLHSRFLD
jgi:hypothetical protein